MPEKYGCEEGLRTRTMPHPELQHPTTFSVPGLSYPLGILDLAINRERKAAWLIDPGTVY